MNCGEIQVRLADDVLGEVSGVDQDAVAEHLAGCAVCAEERRAFEQAVGLLREMEWPLVEAVLEAPRRERVETRAAEPVRSRGGRRRRVAVLSLSSLAAAALIAAIAVPTLLPKRVSPRPAESIAMRAPGSTVPEKAARAAVADAEKAKPATHPGLATRKAEVADGEWARLTAAPAIEPAPTTTMAPKEYETFSFQELQARKLQKRAYGATAADIQSGVAGGVVGGVVGGAPGAPDGLMRYSADSARMDRAMVTTARSRRDPARDMFFQHQGTNPFVPTEEDSLSTFGLDVDTASYAVTRNYLGRGVLPPASAVRVEEFVNALPQDYAAPRNEAFAIHVEGAPSPFQPGHYLLRVGLKAREVRARERKPANLTFVIDVSGSMAMENRLGLVRRSLRLLVKSLDERDRIGIVVYGTRGRVVLDPTPASDRTTILLAIDALRPEGSTNLEEGLELGYRMALETLDPSATNRVVLCTDGVANNGVTDPETLLKRIHARAEKRVFLTALGFGMGNYNDTLLQKLADQGDGQYAYIDDDREAERFFLRNLSGVLEVVARDAKAQVEFDPSAVDSYRLLGYEKRDVADEDFRNDDVDGGEVGAGHAVTVLYELKLRGRTGRLGTVNVRFIDPDTGAPQELARNVEGADLEPRFDAASAGFRLAAVTARFAEHLRRSYWVRGERLDEVLDVAERLPTHALRGAEASDLLDLMREAVALLETGAPGRIR
jgi:Ca-activated chloride channel homolog